MSICVKYVKNLTNSVVYANYIRYNERDNKF